MSDPNRIADPAEAMFAWLAAEPADDPIVDLVALRTHLVALNEGAVSSARLQGCADQFDIRVRDLSNRLRPRLLTATLPLPRDLHQAIGDLVAALLDLAAVFRRLVEDLRQRWLRTQIVEAATLVAQALQLLSEAGFNAVMAGSTLPFGLWQHAHALAVGAARQEGGRDGEIGAQARWAFHYKRLLCLAVVQPESLTPRELSWLFEYLEGAAGRARLERAPALLDSAAYWIDPAQDSPPVAVARRAAPDVDGLWCFDPAPLARRVAEQIEWLENRILEAEVVGLERDGELLASDLSGLPEGLTPVEVLSLLRRLRDRWSAPLLREQPRRRHQYTVQVCAGLRAIWDLGRHGESSARLAEWLVLNESPGGYAIMCVAGIEGVLSAGMALALRRGAGQPWTICIVRWIRSDNPDQVELGLQVVAQDFTAVQIAFRNADTPHTVPALILPQLDSVRRAEALLAPAGSYVSRRFVLMQEGERLYVAQCRALGLDLQTANIELFQYEIDPYPT
ncbi:hypothetical protein dqs_3298 [Azoarcus olearius]|uniref:hypothetical protein n=1 Tax=Azoarcus sp. (strain BH72) TaxID=418699 RepID=UPI0008062A49|nr:hypothetical protein [Azoarcus olearius]ANQ86325.1 hypothetical protein dqs_3298 [Azoarcus olearius]